MRKVIENLLNSEITAYEISKQTGVSNSVISRLKSGERTIGKLSLDTAEKLYDYGTEIMKMNELENKMIKNLEIGEIELVNPLKESFIDIQGDYEYDVEFANLIEVEYKGRTLYEVSISKTYEVPYHEALEKDNMNLFYDEWLSEDQEGETYIESVFFENKGDAESYIKDVLKGKDTLEEVAEDLGYFE